MIILVLVILGVCFGSFVNALVWRLHKQEKLRSKKARKQYSITTGRSMCTHCRHILGAKDLVPIVSWLSLRGKCRYCQKPIADTPLSELLVPLLFVLSYGFWPYGFAQRGVVLFCFWLVFLVGFVALFLYDLRWYLLPDRIVFPLFGLAGVQVLIEVIFLGSDGSRLLGAFWGVVFGGGIFWVLFQVSDGKWIGGGDVKLGFVYGMLLGGPVAALLCIFLASLLGTVVSVPMLLAGKAKRKSQLPFGPFLITAVIIVYLCGQSLVTWYKQQVGLI